MNLKAKLRKAKLRDAVPLALFWCLLMTGCGGGGHSDPPPAPAPPAPMLSLATIRQAGPISIMPLGDSITFGATDPEGNGYRKRLWDDLTSAGYTVVYEGSISNGSADLPDTHNEGHGGYRIDNLAAGVDRWLKGTKPAVILLMAGTNDVLQDHDLKGAPGRLSDLIEQIRRDDPPAQVLVASIPPLSLSSGLEAKAEAYNAQIPGLVAAKAALGEPVVFVDVHAVLTPADLTDGIHPNPGGYVKIGDAWFQALQSL